MKKKLLLSAVVAATVLSSSISVCAAPQYMADGAVFDPEWYLEQDPNMAAALEALGLDTSADTLYLHYTLFGAKEGRYPYDQEQFDPASVLPYQGTGAAPAAQATTSQTQTDNTERIFAVEGQTYSFPSIHSSRYNCENCTVTMTFSKADVFAENYDYYYDYFPDYLAAYTLPGYEWKKFDVSAYSTPGSYYMDISTPGDFLKNRIWTSDDNITNYDSVWEYLDPDNWVTHVATFTVSQNGTDYPDCKLFETWNPANAGIASFSWFALVPKGFSGGLYAGYGGAKLENGKAVPDESNPYILFEF